MSKRLEDLFNLAATDELKLINEIKDSKAVIQQINSDLDKIDQALPLVTGLNTSDQEMDNIADLATNTFNDLISLSMSVEPRFSGPILQAATTLLGHAVAAKTAKMEMKLKSIDLQLKKMKLDQFNCKDLKNTNSPSDGDGMIVDRNELLRYLLQNGNSN